MENPRLKRWFMSFPVVQSRFSQCGDNVVVYSGAKILSPETITVSAALVALDIQGH
jgi:hypothetical protein